VGAIAGSTIANRNANRRWKSDRQESRLSLARQAAIEVAEASYRWASAQYDYERKQLGIGNDNEPPAPSLSEVLGNANTRQAIAFATLYVSVADQATKDAARALEDVRTPYQMFMDEDAGAVIDGNRSARNRSLMRLVLRSKDFETAIRDYVEAIAHILAPMPES
jgi:hypothetical protein